MIVSERDLMQDFGHQLRPCHTVAAADMWHHPLRCWGLPLPTKTMKPTEILRLILDTWGAGAREWPRDSDPKGVSRALECGAC